MAAKKGFEGFEAVFGEATAEWDPETAASSAAPSLRPFLFHAHAPAPSCLEVMTTDFHSLTFARVLSVHDLEDLRDDIGIGGSWSEFVDYLKSSLSAGYIKLILDGLQNGDSEQQRSLHLMESLSSERERNRNLQNQLDSLSFLSKRKAPMPKSSDVLINSSETAFSSGLQQSTEVAATKGSQTTKISQRGAPMSRRPRVRGVSLHDTQDDDNDN